MTNLSTFVTNNVSNIPALQLTEKSFQRLPSLMDIQRIDVKQLRRDNPDDELLTARCPACGVGWMDIEYTSGDGEPCPHLQFKIDPYPDNHSGVWVYNGFRVGMLSEVLLNLTGHHDDAYFIISGINEKTISRYLVDNCQNLSLWTNIETPHVDTILFYDDCYEEGPINDPFTTIFGVKMQVESSSSVV